MKKSKGGKSCLTSVLLTIVIFITIIIVVAITTSNDDSSPDSNSANTAQVGTNGEVADPAETTGEHAPSVLHEDDYFAIEFMKIYDVDGIDTSYLQLKVTNKSDQKLTLSLADVYTNDISVQSGTAMPIELEPGKISQTPFILFTANTGLKAEDITKIEFVLNGLDDGWNMAHTTDKIVIDIGK